jgi:hypothetical protein
MLKHWLIELIGHVSGLSDAQLRQIEKSFPASKALKRDELRNSERRDLRADAAGA